jgi:hypothetical protein
MTMMILLMIIVIELLDAYTNPLPLEGIKESK